MSWNCKLERELKWVNKIRFNKSITNKLEETSGHHCLEAFNISD